MAKSWNFFQDWKANFKNPKGRVIMILFRIAYCARCGPSCIRPLAVLYGPAYRLGVEWLLGVELPWKTRIGPGLRVDHGVGLVVNDGTRIGTGCFLRHNTTIGNKQLEGGAYSECPVVGDRVDVGANVVIIGPVRIGNDAVIGAGAVVVKDVPPGAVVVGNPARIVRYRLSN
jgi:putative colanic acid biosynthesis acetyltransferase WcaB